MRLQIWDERTNLYIFFDYETSIKKCIIFRFKRNYVNISIFSAFFVLQFFFYSYIQYSYIYENQTCRLHAIYKYINYFTMLLALLFVTISFAMRVSCKNAISIVRWLRLQKKKCHVLYPLLRLHRNTLCIHAFFLWHSLVAFASSDHKTTLHLYHTVCFCSGNIGRPVSFTRPMTS